MKYYKIDFKSGFPEEDRVLGHANGEFVPNGKLYFDRMEKGEIIYDVPILEYFHLQSFGPKEEWEWRVQDVHGFIGTGSILSGWYISDRFKKLLDKFSIASHRFYATKLLYKGEKLDYWIFQFPLNAYQNLDFSKSTLFLKDTHEIINGISSWEEFHAAKRKYKKEMNQKLILKKGVFSTYFDFSYNIIGGDNLVSEKLKNAIQEAGLESLEFFELEYEVEFSNPA